MPTIGASAVTQDPQQGSGFLTIRNTKDAVRPRESRQFSGLLHVADQQEQKFSRTTLGLRTPVAQLEDVASQQGGDFFRRNLLAHARHTQKRAQRTGNRESHRVRRLHGHLLRCVGRIGTPSGRSEVRASAQRHGYKGGDEKRRLHGRSPLRTLETFNESSGDAGNRNVRCRSKQRNRPKLANVQGPPEKINQPSS